MYKHIKDTATYNKIKDSDKDFNILYYEKSDIIINLNNIEYILDIELMYYESINTLMDRNDDMLKEKLLERLYGMLGENYMKTNVANLNSSNIDSVSEEMEKNEKFGYWLVK